MTAIDVVVPVHGNWVATRSCLTALRAQTLAHRVILVDDASPDDTVDRVRAEFPEVDIVVLATNCGFASACNAGIRRGTGEIVVLLNNDVDAEPRLLEVVASALRDQPSAGSAAAVLVAPDGSIDSYGIAADVTLAGFVRYAGAESRPAESLELLGPYGALAVYRRRALDEVGLLDERIFMYGEELDLALRLAAAGWECVAIDEVLGVHVGGGTAGRGSARQRELSGFGRGYLLRVWGVVRSPVGARAVLVEALVSLIAILRARDLAGVRGRMRGWRAGAGVPRRTPPARGIDRSIGVIRSLRLRSPGYWKRADPTSGR